jgi:hypothetical protein
MMRMMRLLSIIFCLLFCLLPLTAQAQEEDSVVTLRFYTHPTERYNIFIPQGWENLSTETHAHLVNEALGAEVWAVADDEDALSVVQALAGIDATPLMGDEVTLTTGTWQQWFYLLPDGTATTAFVQQYEGRSYAILYWSRQGAMQFVLRTDTPLQDREGARAVFARMLSLLAVDAEAYGDLVQSPPDIDPPLFAGQYRQGEQFWAVTAERASPSAADVSFAPAPTGTGSTTPSIALTIVRDFFITPETTDYLWLGLAVSLAVIGMFVLWLWVRWRNLERDEEALRAISD